MDPAVIGVDLGGTNLRSAILTRSGALIDRTKRATIASEGHRQVIQRLIDDINAQRKGAEVRGLRIDAVGVGAPGVIQADTGVVIKSPNFPDWNELPLKKELEQGVGIPVFVENDANAAAFGEHWRGAGKDVRSLIFITLGTGVGGGIILDGKIWHGADGMAGEVGHMTILPEGRKCGCGNRGCLEMYASSRGIVMSYREIRTREGATEVPEGITSEIIYNAAREGERSALTVMELMGRSLGIGIANLINIFNPEMVVIGGGVREAWPLFIDAARREILQRAFAYPAERTKLVPSELGDDAGMVGAAAVAFDRMN